MLKIKKLLRKSLRRGKEVIIYLMLNLINYILDIEFNVYVRGANVERVTDQRKKEKN